MYKFNLYLLKVIMIVIITLCEICTKVIYQKYHLPLRWLNHYLKGSGKGMKVPSEVVQEAGSALNAALNYHYDPNTNKACVNHSTLYDGSGFSNRPVLFYLLGGFTFKVSNQLDENTLLVYGVDHYDWHITKQWDDYYECYKEFYFSSPLGSNFAIKFVIKMLDKIFGNELFINSCTIGNPDDCAISNKLWEEMKKVGAKEFYSSFVATIKYENLEF